MNDWDPDILYHQAQRAEAKMSGYYNENVRVDTPAGPVLVRIPVAQADQMDLHIWNEYEVLHAVSQHVPQVPRVLHVSTDPAFQIHEFINGRQLNEVYPRGSRVPSSLIPEVLDLFSRLPTIQRHELPPLPPNWPEDGGCAEFADMLSGITQQIFDDSLSDFSTLFDDFGIPDEPLGVAVTGWSTMTPRPFQVVHSDIHRQNMLLSPRGVVFLDWELALWGDPVYELAVHVHKMTYLDDELTILLDNWEAAMARCTIRGWRRDLAAYLRHEKVKSAIVDSIRYTKEIASGLADKTRSKTLIDKLTGKLNAAGQVWQWDRNLTTSEVSSAVTRWAAG